MRNTAKFFLVCFVLIFVLSLMPAPRGVRAETFNFYVNDTGDTSDADTSNNICSDSAGNCTLRAALEQSKTLHSTNTINIYFQLNSPATIVLHSDLTTFTNANIINNDPLKRIIIDGNQKKGLIIWDEKTTTIKGLKFQNFNGAAVTMYYSGTDYIENNIFSYNDIGIEITGSSNGFGTVHITSNYIGYDPITETRQPNTTGIQVVGNDSNTDSNLLWIGGDSIEKRNVIAGNGESGIYINNEDLDTEIVIRNNYIGMVDDTTPLGNYDHGIYILKSLGRVIIGGDYLTKGNLISGNNDKGLYIRESNNALIAGNTFSANRSGTQYIPNQWGDIEVYQSPYLTIGGDDNDLGNVIPQGVSVKWPNNVNLKVKHNYLGISRNDFVFPIGSGKNGIDIDNVSGISEISFNKITGFRKGIIVGANSNVPILNNHIYNNSVMGIDLNNDGVTLNDDPPDGDTGPNGLQNFPIFSNVEVTEIGTAKQVMFDLTIAAAKNTIYLLQVFSSPFCNSSGYGEGKQIFYSNPVTTDDNGYGVIEEITDFYPTNIKGPCLAATATLLENATFKPIATSEFSQGVMAWQPEKIFLPLILK